jgi:uridine phosphorylase
VLVTGLAGGCAPDVGSGEILVGSVVGPTARGAWVVPDASFTARVLGAVRASRLPHRVGPLVTVGAAAATPEAKAALWRAHQAVGVDMESAHVLDWAAAAGLPAAVVRAVADGPRDALPPALVRAVSPDGRTRWTVVAGWVARPEVFLTAWRFRRRGHLALDRLARVVLTLAACPS